MGGAQDAAHGAGESATLSGGTNDDWRIGSQAGDTPGRRSGGDRIVGQGALLTARNRAVAGRMDLLSVLAHEMGHAIGHGHHDAGLMAESLLPRQQATPAPWFSAAPAAAAHGPRPAMQAAAVIDGAASPLPALPAWQRRFVNHLGQAGGRGFATAGLALHLPVQAQGAPKLPAPAR